MDTKKIEALVKAGTLSKEEGDKLIAAMAAPSNGGFLKSAKPQAVRIGDTLVGVAQPRQFSSGSLGYGLYGTAVMEINGEAVEFQVSMNLTVKGSKPAAAA